jgi:hypothetical protein
MDLIDAIAGPNHESVVKACLSPLFRRKYSSITDVCDNMFRRRAEENPNEQELQEEHCKISRLPGYGEPFQLSAPPIPDEKTQFEKITPSGKRWIIHLSRWMNILTKGDKAQRMEKYPFDVVCAQVFEETGREVFKKPLWLMVTGRRRRELTPEQVYGSYAQRYDIEHCFRFGKQKLLLARSQTPDTRHEENLAWVTMLSFAMLYQTRRLAIEVRYPWERRRVTSIVRTPPITQVQRDYGRIIRGIGTPARIPKPRGKSVGRPSGTNVPHRTMWPIIRKRRPIVAQC